MMPVVPAIAALLVSVANPSSARGTTHPRPKSVVRLEVYPTTILFTGKADRRQLVLTGRYSDNSATDLTRSAAIRLEGPIIVSIENGVVRPLSDGATVLLVSASGQSVRVPITVKNSQYERPWTFENHVESVFSKQGCNSGPCHGAGSGKGGFKLSLRAYDPAADYERICREGIGRRIARGAPGRSLLLTKPSLGTAHQGGLRLPAGSLEYQVVSRWIANGCPPASPQTARLVKLEVYPSERTLRTGGSQQLSVLANFSDGHLEDVTHWARYSSSEESLARVDEQGRVQMVGFGETAVNVWYLGKVAFSRLTVPYPNPIALAGARSNASVGFTDRMIDSKLATLHLAPSARCTDLEFVRRVYLDTLGTLPTRREAQQFAADRTPLKRTALIDAILQRPEYTDFWTYKWADLLRVNRDLLGDKGMWQFYAWLREQVEVNRPWDQIVKDILTADGDTSIRGPANFYRLGAKPEEFAENVSQAFLGIRVQCAKCHNHPFEKWTQSDYYRMAGLFARVGQKRPKGSPSAIVYSKSTGDVDHPRLGRPLPPAPFDGAPLPPSSNLDRRQYLADWMTSPNNPYFARSIVNRVWKHYMGRGLVEPVDDMRLTNPASNEPLLAALSQDFTSHGFDLRRLARTILSSNAYQRSSSVNAMNAADDRFYSHYLVRRIAAEPLIDAISQVTGAAEKFAGAPRGCRAIALPDTRITSGFLDLFGRPARQVTCECERNNDANVSQALHVISGDTINKKVSAKDGILQRLLTADKSDADILNELCWSCFSRAATASESDTFTRALISAKAAPGADLKQLRAHIFNDLFWAMVNSSEFTFNH